MTRTLTLLVVCLGLTGCTLRSSALVLAASLDVYATIKIEEATPEERAKLRADLVAGRGGAVDEGPKSSSSPPWSEGEIGGLYLRLLLAPKE